MDRDQNRGDEGVRTTTRIGMNERIATRAVLTAVVVLALAATALVAQRAPSQLTLEEAITLAKGNNPLYLSTRTTWLRPTGRRERHMPRSCPRST